MQSMSRDFSPGAASRRLKEADRRLHGDPPKEAGRTEAPGQSGGNAPRGLGRAGNAGQGPARKGDDQGP